MTNGVYNRTDTLPPIGVSPESPEARSLVELIYQRRQACITALGRPLQIARTCRKVAAWGEDVEWPDDCKTIVHKSRQSIETQVANHLKEPVQITIEPFETGEYARWYWCGPAEVAAEIGLDPIYLGGMNPVDGSPFPPAPLPMALVKTLRLYVEAGEIENSFFCQLNDEYTAKTLQKQFDADWKAAKGQQWMRSMVYGSTVQGWELRLVEFDKDKQKHLLRDNSIEQTYIDQSHERIDDATEGGIDLYLDLDEAMAMAPSDEIRRRLLKNDSWINSNGQSAPANGGMVPPQFKGDFGRPILRKIVWWLDNQQNLMPMDEQEAIDGGLVQAIMPEVPEVEPGLQGTGLGETGEGSQQNGMGSGSYILPTGEPTAPDQPNWPGKIEYTLRRVTIAGDQLIEDIKSPEPIIPLVQVRNSLVIGKPWSVGEPFYTVNLQEIISDVFNSARQHVKFNAKPGRTMPLGLKVVLEKEFGTAFIEHGTIIGLPPPYDQWKDPVVKTIESDPFPDSSFRILAIANDQFNQISGRSDVQAGNAPNSNSSGELAKTLLSAASEPLNFKAQDISFAAERTVEIMMFHILNNRDPQAISDTTSVPLPLLMLLIARAIKRPPQYKITVSTGAGAVIQVKRAQFVQYNQLKDPATNMPLVSARTTREVLGVIPNVEDDRNQQAVKNAALTFAPMQGVAATASQPQEQGEQPADGNGNGHGNNGVGGRFQE